MADLATRLGVFTDPANPVNETSNISRVFADPKKVKLLGLLCDKALPNRLLMPLSVHRINAEYGTKEKL